MKLLMFALQNLRLPKGIHFLTTYFKHLKTNSHNKLVYSKHLFFKYRYTKYVVTKLNTFKVCTAFIIG